MSNEDTVNTFYLWNGVVYVAPLLGGYIADTFLGRYKTILVFFVVYIFGLVIFQSGSYPGRVNTSLIFLGMFGVAVGAGGIKPNLSTMGADQFDLKNKQEESASKKFFSYFYWAINFGAFLAYTFVAYICQYGLSFLGGVEFGFFVGYFIPTIALFLGIVLFVSNSYKYKKFAPKGSMVSRAVGIIYEAVLLRENNRCLSGHWLDVASIDNGGSYSKNEVESVNYVLKLLPFLAVTIPYKGVYGHTTTAFQLQGCQMNSKLGSIQLPISTMNIFSCLTVVVLIPLFVLYLYPAIKISGYKLTMLKKIGFGFFFATLSMLIAAVIEVLRVYYTPVEDNWYDINARNNISPCRNIDNYNPVRYTEWYNGADISQPSNCWVIASDICTLAANQVLTPDCVSCDNIPQMSSMSIFWQAPQFIVIGIAEIFASITALEFFYSQTPHSMRSVSQALSLFTNALGSWLTIPLTLLVNFNPTHPWIASNINEGHLDYYFCLLAALMTAGLFVFVMISKRFTYALLEELDLLNQEVHNVSNRDGTGDQKDEIMSDNCFNGGDDGTRT